ncbi:MAG: sensor histidine kinase, partial [Longimicrobiales bacterium]
ACESVAVLAREKGIELEYSAARELPDVKVDRGRIIQVLSNLISNALRFTPEAGRIEVRAHEDEGAIKISVRDTGPGIRPEDREAIFLPFWQAMRGARQGAGLGLTIARAIIEQHGGRIWVESEEGAGTTFSFTIPLARRREDSQAAAA